MSRAALRAVVLLVALGAVAIAGVNPLAGERVESSGALEQPCARLATRAFLGLERASVDAVTPSRVISAGRDATVTIVQSCSLDPLVGTLRLSLATGKIAPSGGWVTTDEPWSGAAFVFPPLADATLGVQDEGGTPLALAAFAEARPTAGADCISNGDALLRPVRCGFNIVVTVPAPTGLKDPTDLQSLVPTAWFGAERTFLQAYVYGVADAIDGTRVTVAVQRPQAAGPIGFHWDELTLVGGAVQHPSESYSFNFAPPP